MDIIEKVEQRLSLYASKSTVLSRKSILSQFFLHAGEKEDYTEDDAISFLNWAKNHYKGTSINHVYASLRWFYRQVLKKDLQLKPPEPDYDSIEAVPLSRKDVIRLILATKFIDDPMIRTFVALSTIYGARRKEMADLTPEDVDIERRKIFIKTAKSGRDTWRWMYLPDEIVPVMEEFKKNYRKIHLSGVSVAFWAVLRKAGVDPETRRVGWHMVRRRLIIELTKTGLSDYQIVRFMRWKRKDAVSSILYRYRQSEPDEELIEGVDKEVMKVHPFLKYWELVHGNKNTPAERNS